MATHYASDLKTTPEKLHEEVSIIKNNAVITALMQMLNGVVLVLDKNRQIVAANNTILKSLGITSTDSLLGLRPGEAFGCTMASNGNGGCGTTSYCTSCGAALTIVAVLNSHNSSSRYCVMERGAPEEQLFFKVTGSFMELDGDPYVVILINDVTAGQILANLNHTFYHDISNSIGALTGTIDLMTFEPYNSSLLRDLEIISRRLRQEVNLHKLMQHKLPDALTVSRTEFSVEEFTSELRRRLRTLKPGLDVDAITIIASQNVGTLYTDFILSLRVVFNMVVNAIEASRDMEEVHISFSRTGDTVSVSVHNSRAVPRSVRPRLFQPNFSTRGGPGRGLGTTTMKQIGEKVLGGTVSWETSAALGTTFTFTLTA